MALVGTFLYHPVNDVEMLMEEVWTDEEEMWDIMIWRKMHVDFDLTNYDRAGGHVVIIPRPVGVAKMQARIKLLPANWLGEWVYWQSLLECDKCEAVSSA
jgi:hypothetical protein